MKKFFLAAGCFVLILLVLFIAAVFYSFKEVMPTTQKINKDLNQYFSKVIYIPSGIPAPIQDFNQTIYFWEMETPEKEVVGVRLIHNTGFSKKQNIIRLILEMEEKGDPSIFNKVMPAVIADKQSLDSARDPQKANLAANKEVGYQSIKLTTTKNTNQTIQIVWEFEKSNLPNGLNSHYQKLERLPDPITKFLYALPHFILSLFSS